MDIKELNDGNFNDFIAGDISLVDFWAPWCGPCKMIAPTLEELAKDNPDLPIGKLNIDNNQEIASNYNVMSIPTLIIFKEGKPLNSIVGVKSKESIQKKIDSSK